MKKIIVSLIIAVVAALVGFGYFYVSLPAINLHSPGFWWFIIGGMFIISLVIMFVTMNYQADGKPGTKYFKNNMFKIASILTLILVLIFVLGSLLSSPIINSKKYVNMINIENRQFTEDIKESSYKEIPVLDKASATLLGSRKMGSMIEYVSQFEVADNYTQINYKNTPTRVTPLEYGGFIKWITNKKEGIPAYMSIDMTNQNVTLVQLEEGIKYSESDKFGRNIHRYIRFNYPSYMFDDINFEINDEGVPYWVCPVNDYTIGLFGGKTIRKVVLVNAITGEHESYDIKEVPTWVDKVFSADLLIQHYDYYGTLRLGYLNSIFGQRETLETTDGYNYLALEDDVWVYTGITSTGGDESNVGFVLMNQRTAETRYYGVSGAEEYSAMESAEGKVQHLGYRATFPLLLNIGGQPTYFISLKDAAGLVKSYAMVNIEKYSLVATGTTLQETEREYLAAIEPIHSSTSTKELSISSTITKIVEGVVEGNSYFYLLLEGSNEIFSVKLSDLIDVIKYNEGDSIQLSYKEGSRYHTVTEIK